MYCADEHVILSKDRTLMVGGRSAIVKSTWGLYPQASTYHVMKSWLSRSADRTKQSQPDEFMEMTLLPPRNGIGMAQGVAEYVFNVKNQAGERIVSLSRQLLGSAITDPRMSLWIETERLTDQQAQALLAPLIAKSSPSNAATSKPSKTQAK